MYSIHMHFTFALSCIMTLQTSLQLLVPFSCIEISLFILQTERSSGRRCLSDQTFSQQQLIELTLVLQTDTACRILNVFPSFMAFL